MRELFESMVSRLLSENVTPELITQAEQGQWPGDLWRLVDEAGLPLALCPEDQGGTGASWGDIFPVIMLAGRHAVPLPLPETLAANWLLCQAGLDPQIGPLTLAAGNLELHDGKVTGQLNHVPWGREVQHVVALAEAGQAPQVVLLEAASAQVEPQLNVAREARDQLRFDNVAPVATGPLNAAYTRDTIMQLGAMLRAAQIAGGLHGVLDMATTYANERTQFGRPIGKFQAIQHQIAVLSEHAAMAVAAADAAFAAADQELNQFLIASAKAVASESAGVSAGIAHAVHGAIGFTYEHALQFNTRRLWAWRSEFGSQTFWSQHIGRQICNAGSHAFWPTITGAHAISTEQNA